MLIPKINFQLLLQDDNSTLTNLRHAVCETGFLIVENSPITKQSVSELIAVYRAFFHQSVQKKEPLDMAKTGSNRGWGRSGGEQVNPDANPDYKEVYDVGVELENDDKRKNITYYAPNLWPDEREFRETVLAYYHSAFDVSIRLLEEIARAADLPGDFFQDKFNPPMALLRANYYPPRPKNAGAKDFGIAEHTDYGCLTLLAMDGVSGLEVQLGDGHWEPVNAQPGEFVINFGEMLERWSGGRIKATLHRVRGSDEERISVPFFLKPSYDTNVAPIGSDERLKAGDYLTKRYDETYVHRQKATM